MNVNSSALISMSSCITHFSQISYIQWYRLWNGGHFGLNVLISIRFFAPYIGGMCYILLRNKQWLATSSCLCPCLLMKMCLSKENQMQFKCKQHCSVTLAELYSLPTPFLFQLKYHEYWWRLQSSLESQSEWDSLVCLLWPLLLFSMLSI